MKEVFFIMAVTFLSSSVMANCNLSLAKASGLYLAELEKAKLQEYQGGGACKILDSEYKKCNQNEKMKLAKAVDLTEVLGNICMPHLPPPAPN